MQIFTELQGAFTASSIGELWRLQLGYLLSFCTRQRADLPPLGQLPRLEYLPDPKNRDTWATVKAILTNGGDDCEGLAALFCALFLVEASKKGSIRGPDGRLVALPVLAHFSGHVLHAVIDLEPGFAASLGIAELCWPKYPRCLREMPSRLTFDPSWLCGMDFPAVYLDRVVRPLYSTVSEGKVIRGAYAI